jgi:hypothetical protein
MQFFILKFKFNFLSRIHAYIQNLSALDIMIDINMEDLLKSFSDNEYFREIKMYNIFSLWKQLCNPKAF